MADGKRDGRDREWEGVGRLKTSTNIRKTEIINAMQCQYLLQLKMCMSVSMRVQTNGRSANVLQQMVITHWRLRTGVLYLRGSNRKQFVTK